MPTRAGTRNFCRGYPFRSQPEYRKEIRQADGPEPPKPGFPYCAAPWSAVPKLEPGCGVIAILLESPAGGQGVHEVQPPAPPSAPETPGRNAGTVAPLRSVTCTRMTSPSLRTVTVTVRPGSPEVLCRTLLVTSSLSRSTTVSPARVPPAQHRRRERAGHGDALGAPGDGHALTSRRSGHDDAIPSATTCRGRTASAAQKAASSRPTGNPARTHARSTYRPTSRQHRPARVPRGRQGQHRFSTRSGNSRKQPAFNWTIPARE
jgi:hypothetical protein